MKKLLFLLIITLPAFSFAQDFDPPIERFHTYDEVTDELQQYAESYPNICRIQSIGQSLEGRDIWAIKISDHPQIDEDEPTILIDGHIHAEEILGVEISMMLIENLLTQYGESDSLTYWVSHTEIWIVPIGNPDGHQVVMEGTDICYRKTKHDNNLNGVFDYNVAPCLGNGVCTLIDRSDCDGVDLNRNFSWGWEGNPDNDEPCSEYYGGEAPFSEPEALALANLASDIRPSISVIYHSSRSGNYSEKVIFPWTGRYGLSPDYVHISDLARTMAGLIPTDSLDGVYGTLRTSENRGFANNWLYAELGSFALTVEVGACERIQPREAALIDDVCQRNLNGIYELFRRVHGVSGGVLTGIVRDAITDSVISGAQVQVVEIDSERLPPRTTDSFGRFRRLMRFSNTTSYTLRITHPAYGTRIIPNLMLTPANPVIDLEIELEAPGYGTLQGMVFDGASIAQPLAGATVTFRDPYVGSQHIITDSSGFYRFEEIETGNHYQLSIQKAGYDIQERPITIEDSTVLDIDFTLIPVIDFEGTPGGFWSSDSSGWQWGVPASSGGPASAHSDSTVWGTELDELYRPLSTFYLYSPTYTLVPDATGQVALAFYHWYRIRSTDGGNVQITTDGGETWTVIEPEGGYPRSRITVLDNEPGFSGYQSVWHHVQFDLTDYLFETVQFRFRFSSADSRDRGWFIDDVAVYGQEIYVGVEHTTTLASPQHLTLYPNYPNPFNPLTTIRFDLPWRTHALLRIYDASGKLVQTLMDEERNAGQHRVQWHGTDAHGQAVRSGIYFYRLETPSGQVTQSMVLLR